MSKLGLKELKKVYDLFKDVNYWINKNDLRNSVIALEEVANYIGDFNQNICVNMFDYIHKKYDDVYNNVDKNLVFPEFKKKVLTMKVVIYSYYLEENYAYYKSLIRNSVMVCNLCDQKNSLAYSKAKELYEDLKKVDSSLYLQYSRVIDTLINSYYGDYTRLKDITQNYVGSASKTKISELEELFSKY